MKKSTRIIISFLGSLVSLISIHLPFSLLMNSLEIRTRLIITLVISVLIGSFLWFITDNVSKKFTDKLFTTATIIGVIGFAIGFIGPIIFTPEANQGPLLGIFVTGPLSFVVGLIGAGVYWKTKFNKNNN